MEIVRLGPGDEILALALFELMAEAFEEEAEVLPLPYLTELLSRSDLWILAALEAGQPLGGLTAHRLPLTRIARSELFIYDLAVAPAHQRRGVGRALVAAICAAAEAAGYASVFVPADNEDEHALDFYHAIGGAAAPVTIFTFEKE